MRIHAKRSGQHGSTLPQRSTDKSDMQLAWMTFRMGMPRGPAVVNMTSHTRQNAAVLAEAFAAASKIYDNDRFPPHLVSAAHAQPQTRFPGSACGRAQTDCL